MQGYSLVCFPDRGLLIGPVHPPVSRRIIGYWEANGLAALDLKGRPWTNQMWPVSCGTEGGCLVLPLGGSDVSGFGSLVLPDSMDGTSSSWVCFSYIYMFFESFVFLKKINDSLGWVARLVRAVS